MNIFERFVEHNKVSPVVAMAWLDKDRKEPTGEPDTWVISKRTLQDGTVYFVPESEVDKEVKTIWWSKNGNFEV